MLSISLIFCSISFTLLEQAVSEKDSMNARVSERMLLKMEEFKTASFLVSFLLLRSINDSTLMRERPLLTFLRPDQVPFSLEHLVEYSVREHDFAIRRALPCFSRSIANFAAIMKSIF